MAPHQNKRINLSLMKDILVLRLKGFNGSKISELLKITTSTTHKYIHAFPNMELYQKEELMVKVTGEICQ